MSLLSVECLLNNLNLDLNGKLDLVIDKRNSAAVYYKKIVLGLGIISLSLSFKLSHLIRILWLVCLVS